MGFKLVRIDATEPCKIPLPVGTHFIGRGKFLECHDNRVSRNHGQLEVTGDTVRIIALHQNPCFYRRKCSQSTSILPQNEHIELSNGDQFGLVPESYWYELIYCIENLMPVCGDHTPTPVKVEKYNGDEPSVSGSTENVSQIDIDNTERVEPSISQSTLLDTEFNTEMPSTSPYKRSHSEDSDSTVVKKLKTQPLNLVHNEDQVGNNKNNSEINAVNSKSQAVNHESQAVHNESHAVNSESRTVNSESHAVNSESQSVNSESQIVNNESQTIKETMQGPISTSSIDKDIPDEGIQDTDEFDTCESEKESGTPVVTVKPEPSSPATENTETNNENSAKTEPRNTVKIEPSNAVKTEPNGQENVKPGPSNSDSEDANAGVAPAAAGKGDAGGAGPAAAPAAGARPREKCMYGAQCYRVNPAHKAQFSHPDDPDWAARLPCRWGAACRNIRPQHWRDYEHPPRQPPAPHPPHPPRRGGHGIRVVQRHGNIFYINANSVHFYDDHFQVQDSDGESVDYDYEF